MKRLVVTGLSVCFILLLIPGTQSTLAQGNEPPVFSDTLNLELSYMIGSDGQDWIQDVKIDSQGNVILAFVITYPIQNTGVSGPPGFYSGPFYDTSPDFREFIITEGAYDTSYNMGGDIILLKMTQQGDILFSTYFGGSKSDFVTGVEVDSNDNIFVVGYSQSDDFPLLNPFNSNSTGLRKAFISKFSTDGDLVMSSFFGGTYLDKISEIIVDEEDNIYLAGSTKSEDFPKVNAAFPNVPVARFIPAAFISKLDSNFTIQYSTLLGGSDIDDDYTISYKDGKITVFGLTRSEDFPITSNAPDSEHNGFLDAFITRFDSVGNAELSTFIGGSLLDWISDSTIDNEGNLIVVGYSNSEDYPTQEGEDRQLNNGYGLSSDAIITKMDPNGHVMWSTFLGGSTQDKAANVLVDSQNHIMVLGETTSNDFPIWGIDDDEIQLNQGVRYDEGTPPKDVFLAKLVPDGRLGWSVVVGSKGQDTFSSGEFIEDGRLFYSGYTIDKLSFEYDNSYEPAALEDSFLGIAEIPQIELGDVATYVGYNDVLNQQNDAYSFLSDTTSLIVIGVVGLVIVYNLVSRSKILERFRSNDNDEWKEGMQSYFDRLREIDEK